MIDIPYLCIRCVATGMYVISYMVYEGRYINMSEKRAVSQFREDFGLKGKRLERLGDS